MLNWFSKYSLLRLFIFFFSFPSSGRSLELKILEIGIDSNELIRKKKLEFNLQDISYLRGIRGFGNGSIILCFKWERIYLHSILFYFRNFIASCSIWRWLRSWAKIAMYAISRIIIWKTVNSFKFNAKMERYAVPEQHLHFVLHYSEW